MCGSPTAIPATRLAPVPPAKKATLFPATPAFATQAVVSTSIQPAGATTVQPTARLAIAMETVTTSQPDTAVGVFQLTPPPTIN
jgi:hypothetical protein